MVRPVSCGDPLLQFLEVPYICGYNASRTKLQFLDILARHGVNWETAQDPSSTGLNIDEAAVFLQDWLFFAALNGVCNLFDVEFNPLDFISSSSEKGPLITGLQFRKYVCFWAGGAEPGTKFSSLSIGRLEKQRGGAAYIIQVLEKTADAWT